MGSRQALRDRRQHKRLTDGQIAQRLAQHAKDRHPHGTDFCDGCMIRWSGMDRMFYGIMRGTMRQVGL